MSQPTGRPRGRPRKTPKEEPAAAPTIMALDIPVAPRSDAQATMWRDAFEVASKPLGRMVTQQVEVKPQPGAQTEFDVCRADIAFSGGMVFGGKTWILTYLPTKHEKVAGFTCVTFRRTAPDIRNPGSLWDEALKMYPLFNATPKDQPLEWHFPSGAKVKFAGLQYETDVLSWKGAQIALLQFDQVEEFTEHQFWYMLTRNRSTSGVKPYCRGTCNPLADTWLAEFIQWWWDPDSGRTIPERSNLARWFVRIHDQVYWAQTECRGDASEAEWEEADVRARAELEEMFPSYGKFAQSFCFIRAVMADNKIGLAIDPDYEGRVRASSHIEQERLLHENWKIRAAAGLVVDRSWFTFVDACPQKVRRRWRYWDKAGIAGGGDWTVGIRLSEDDDGIVYVEDEERGQWSAGDRERVIWQLARNDPRGTRVAVEQEGGSGGLQSAQDTIKLLRGFHVVKDRPTGKLEERINPFASQAQVGNVKIVRGPWNEGFLRELHAFPTKGVPDDRVAATAGAYKMLTQRARLMVA